MAQEAGAAVYSGCWELWLILGDGVHSGDAGFICIDHFDTVVELDAFDEFRQLIYTFQAQPFF